MDKMNTMPKIKQLIISYLQLWHTVGNIPYKSNNQKTKLKQIKTN